MTGRIPLDDLTSDQLDHLYNRLDAARRTVDRVDTQAQQHRQRAETAEATLDRVRALHRDAYPGSPCTGSSCTAGCGTWPCPTLRAINPDQPTTPASHLPDGGNAEDCDACRQGPPLPYPWICPGPQQPTT